MKYLRAGSALVFALAMIGMNAGPAPALTPSWGHHGHHGGNQYLPGQYSGSVTDSVLGSGTATANFAALPSALGGWVSFTFGSATYRAPVSAYSDWSVQGIFIPTIGSAACTFAFKAQYSDSGSSFTLDGKYKAINGCSGENGSFSLTEQCYYQEQGSDLRRNNGLMHC